MMDSRLSLSRRFRRTLVGTIAASAALAVPALASGARATDGTSPATAAASCWEIKQVAPTSPSAVYWLRTPKLQAPKQFYCDMTTDGGGWVLVGRGREGWWPEYQGRGTDAQVSSAVTGTAAFSPRQLSGDTINALLNGGRVDDLTDGIRLRRATDTAGTTWQESRFQMPGRDRWTWTFNARHLVSGIRFDGGSAINNQRSNNFGSDNTYRRIYTDLTSGQGWNGGFGFGSSARGSTATSSYIYTKSANAGYPIPFTQVYLRPKLRTSDLTYPTVPAEGLGKIEQRGLHESGVLPNAWGVTGLTKGSGEMRTEAQAFAQIGDYVYVGGNFRDVQRDAAGTDRVEQHYLAAFNVHTGEWLSTFRPTLDDQVKALVALPNGTLAVGGEFTDVNGQAVNGFTVLDPTTGDVSPTLSLQIENRISNGPDPYVRTMKVHDNWLYLGGQFTHTKASGDTVFEWARNAMRINLTTAKLDVAWNPNLGGTVMDIEPSKDGTKVYVAGYFETAGVNPQPFIKAGMITASTPATPIPWTPTFSITNLIQQFQFTITETAHSVWVGGSEHSFFSYDKNTMERTSGNITMAGGDFQTSVSDDATGVVYGGCHCNDFAYSGTTKYPWPTTFTQGDKMGWIGAWDEETGEREPNFAPRLIVRKGYGAWDSFVDSTGKLWVGGDFVSGTGTNGTSSVWTGGFVRFAPRDTTAPAAPSDLQVRGDTSSVTLEWTPVAESGVTYEVLENGRVIATTTSSTLTVSTASGANSYAVRAADAAGNRSASTAPVAYDPATAPTWTTVVERNSAWKWRYDETPITGWEGVGYDDSSWSTGNAPLGWGSTDLGTDIASGIVGTRPLTAQFRKEFTIADPADLAEVVVTYIADDGAVVYLNGNEISRDNLPAGPLTQTTYASIARNRTAAEDNLVSVTVPATYLVAGTNVLSGQMHLGYRSSPNATFYLTADVRERVASDPPPPPAPAVTTTVVDRNSAWKWRYDSTAVSGWEAPAYDDSTWQTGDAPLGWGSTDLGTDIAAGIVGTRPLTAQFRKAFTIDDPSSLDEVTITYIADDGAVIYLNGEEISRANLPDGALTQNTYATLGRSRTTSEGNLVTVTVPASELVSGTNVISGQMHLGYRSTPDATFYLTAETRG